MTIICLSIFLDGLSTTTPTALFALYSLAVNQQVQEKLYEEVKTIVGDKPINPNDISKMQYLKAFLKEVFRYWPNGTEVSRYTDKPMVLSGYQIPIGTHIDLNPGVHFRSADIFPDPDEFRPERWLKPEHLQQSNKEKKSTSGKADKEVSQCPSSEVDEIHPFLLTPFSHGTRMCAGRRFAEQHLHVLLISLVRNFRMEYPVGESMDQIYHTLLWPDRPVRVKFISRKKPQ